MRGSGCCGHGGRDNARFSMGRVRGGHGRLGAGTGHSRDVLGTSLKSLNKEQTYDQEVIGQGSQQPGFGRPMKPAGRRLGTGRPMQPAAQWKLCCTMQRQEGSRYNNALISSKIHDIICSDNIWFVWCAYCLRSLLPITMWLIETNANTWNHYFHILIRVIRFLGLLQTRHSYDLCRKTNKERHHDEHPFNLSRIWWGQWGIFQLHSNWFHQVTHEEHVGYVEARFSGLEAINEDAIQWDGTEVQVWLRWMVSGGRRQKRET